MAAARTGSQEPCVPSLATRMSFGKGDPPGASRAISSGRSAPWAASLAVLPKRIPEAWELPWVPITSRSRSLLSGSSTSIAYLASRSS